MKKTLLIATSLFLGASAFAQQFDATNSPQAGDVITLHILDSMATSYAGITGAGVTWDYSATSGYENETRTVTVENASATPHATSFGTSTLGQDVENFLMTYTTGDATGRVSQGFVFTEALLGEIVAVFDVDPAQYFNYPMDESTPAIVDTYEGEARYNLGGLATSSITGTLAAVVDGKGTLKLAGGDYSDVLRYRVIDTMVVTGVSIIPIAPPVDLEMVRVQYEYYDFANGRLPIFVHTNVTIGQVGGAPMSNISLVLSKDAPTAFVSVSENELANTSVYPNPANENLNIQLPSSIENAEVVITDALGREVYTSTLNAAVKTIDVSKLNKGMYFVNISNNVYSTTKNVVIK